MTDAVIVSTARTPLCKAWKGALNMTYGATLGAHAIAHAVERAGLDPAEIEDCILGAAHTEGTLGGNIARAAALRAGLPVTVGGLTINRQCSSGLQSIALAAQRVMTEGCGPIVAGGLESVSCVQNDLRLDMRRDPWLVENKPAVYMSMLETAETVARRYGIPKEDQDAYGVRSQHRAAAARDAGRFEAEIAPITTVMGVRDPATGEIARREVTARADEGIRPDTRIEEVRNIRSALPGGVVTAGNASQFSDGASAVVVMDARSAERRGV